MNGVHPLPEHLDFGKKGEQFAAEYLQRNGLIILERNWRYRQLEIDLICRDGETIVFVEVKTRKSANYGGALAAITAHKKRNLVRAAQIWLMEKRLWQQPCRMDVLCLTRHGGTFNVEHYQDAIEFTEIVDRRHTSWQPW